MILQDILPSLEQWGEKVKQTPEGEQEQAFVSSRVGESRAAGPLWAQHSPVMGRPHQVQTHLPLLRFPGTQCPLTYGLSDHEWKRADIVLYNGDFGWHHSVVVLCCYYLRKFTEVKMFRWVWALESVCVHDLVTTSSLFSILVLHWNMKVKIDLAHHEV